MSEPAPTPPTASPAAVAPPRPPSIPTGERTALTGELRVIPWADPRLDPVGHHPRSAYVERFWLSVLGPTATWVVRRLASDLEHAPDGMTVDLATTARSIGIGTRGGRHNPFLRSIDRACEFGLAHYLPDGNLAVRRRVPPLTRKQAERLPAPLRSEHATWVSTPPTVPDPSDVHRRARRLALSLIELGEDAAATEHQLHRWRFHPALAHDAVTWAWEQHQAHAPAGGAGAEPPPPTAA